MLSLFSQKYTVVGSKSLVGRGAHSLTEKIWCLGPLTTVHGYVDEGMTPLIRELPQWSQAPWEKKQNERTKDIVTNEKCLFMSGFLG